MKGGGFMPEPARKVLSLDGRWLYKKDLDRAGETQKLYDPSTSRKGWGEMNVPVNWYNTEVGDYHGVIWFAREFTVPDDMKGKEHILRFNAVDYIGEAWLNGVYLGRHEGFFAPFEFRVTDHIKSGTNTLIVKIDSPLDDTEYKHVPRPDIDELVSEPYRLMWPMALKIIKGALIHFYHRPGWETQFGQDGNTGGIWQSVELIATGSLTIDNVKIYPKIVEREGVPDGTALLAVDIDVHNSTNGTVRAEVGMEAWGKNFKSDEEIKKSKEFVLTPGDNRVKVVHTVQRPALWWCWDHGDPNLYQMKITVKTDKIQDEKLETFGIRELKVDGRGQWYLNGRRVFARGMRYLSSIWLGEADEKMFKEDLYKMRQLNINAIRIGSHVEKPRFYELCDEMGFLVWQVFPLHYAYSDSDDLIERASPMMREMVRMLYNHPSIVIWSVFKEPKIYALEPKPNNYGRLCQIMYEEGRTVDPIRWVHTGDYEEGVQNVMPGLTRPGETDLRGLQLKPQIVEFGSGAMPPLETVKEILKPEEIWPPVWDRWFYLNVNPTWFKWQGIDIKSKSGIEELIEESQTWSARQIKESAEFLRQRKYKPVSSMFLYFWNDPWPCLFGSGLLDYYRRKYKSYDIYGMVYSPVLVSIEWVKDKHYVGFEKTYAPGENLIANVWVTNDLYEKYDDASVSWCIKGPDGEVLEEKSQNISILEDSSQIVENLFWPIPGNAEGRYRVEAAVKDRAGELLSNNYFEFKVEGSRRFKK
jgi:beta-mannosidase